MRIAAALFALSLATATQAAPFVDVVARMKTSVVGITTIQTGRALAAQLTGTGFAVADGRHVVTNAHVVAGDGTAPVALIVLIPGRGAPERRGATVVSNDPLHDLALLRIEGAPLPTVKLRREPELVPDGTEVAITGMPIGVALGLVPTTHRGFVSATPSNVGAMPRAGMLDAAMIRTGRFEVYQLDMIAFPGNSGSPLYAADSGEIVGVINSGFIKKTKEKALTEPTAITFAMPVSFLRQMLEKAGLTP